MISVKSEEEVKEMLADAGGNTSIGSSAEGAIAISQRSRRKALREVLGIGADQMICVECLEVQEPGEKWNEPTLCPSCSDEIQTRIGEHTHG